MSCAKSSSRADAVFDFIVKYKQDHDGNSPTLREIGDSVGISSSSVVNFYIERLKKENRILVADSLSRSIEVVGGSWEFKDD